VVLADVAPAMVEVAARRGAGIEQVETIVCDQAAIDASAESFDAVLIRHGLMFAEDPSEAVAEAVRVLRPGGRYGAITWGTREANPWLGIILDSVGEQFGVAFPPPGIAGPFSLDEPDKLAAALNGGG
jgi:ubiquinone/menaquinone biosynthesis C-methylase UbiE